MLRTFFPEVHGGSIVPACFRRTLDPKPARGLERNVSEVKV